MHVPDSCILRKENKFAACKTKSWGKFLILRKINERGEVFWLLNSLEFRLQMPSSVRLVK